MVAKGLKGLWCIVKKGVIMRIELQEGTKLSRTKETNHGIGVYRNFRSRRAERLTSFELSHRGILKSSPSFAYGAAQTALREYGEPVAVSDALVAFRKSGYITDEGDVTPEVIDELRRYILDGPKHEEGRRMQNLVGAMVISGVADEEDMAYFFVKKIIGDSELADA